MKESTAKELQEIIRTRAFRTEEQGPIVTAIGEKNPWMFDFRRILFSPKSLFLAAEVLWERLEPHYPFQIGGLETASIPLIVALVMKGKEKGKPINGFFIRKSRKPEGLQKIIEGEINAEKIILVDDILNSGRTFKKQVAILEREGRKVHAIIAILRFREMDYYTYFTEQGIIVSSIFTLEDFGKTYQRDKKAPLREFFSVDWYVGGEQPNYFYVGPKSAPLVDEQHVYFGTDSGTFLAIRQEDGSVAWSKKILFGSKGKYIFSSPASWRNWVYFGGYDGNVYALEKKTGAVKWVFMEADWIGSSPAVAPDLKLLFIGLEFGLLRKRGGIAALDLETGKKKWEYITPEYTHGSPGYSSKYKVVGIGSNDGVFYLFDARSGKLRWKLTVDGEIKYGCVFDEKRGYVLFGSFDGKLYAVSVKTGEIVFSFQTKAGIYSTPLVVGNTVYVASLDKRLYAIDLVTGTMRWEFLTSGRIFASPEVIGERLYIGSNDGRLYELDFNGKEVALFQATERITNKIGYNARTGKIFLPTYANELYCLSPASEQKRRSE